jgi:hypothetical protein
MREDVREARRLARSMIVLALSVPTFSILLSITQPGFFLDRLWALRYTGMWPWAAALGVYLLGLGWMIRIYRRSHLEPEASSWRYRDT